MLTPLPVRSARSG